MSDDINPEPARSDDDGPDSAVEATASAQSDDVLEEIPLQGAIAH